MFIWVKQALGQRQALSYMDVPNATSLFHPTHPCKENMCEILTNVFLLDSECDCSCPLTGPLSLTEGRDSLKVSSRLFDIVTHCISNSHQTTFISRSFTVSESNIKKEGDMPFRDPGVFSGVLWPGFPEGFLVLDFFAPPRFI